MKQKYQQLQGNLSKILLSFCLNGRDIHEGNNLFIICEDENHRQNILLELPLTNYQLRSLIEMATLQLYNQASQDSKTYSTSSTIYIPIKEVKSCQRILTWFLEWMKWLHNRKWTKTVTIPHHNCGCPECTAVLGIYKE